MPLSKFFILLMVLFSSLVYMGVHVEGENLPPVYNGTGQISTDEDSPVDLDLTECFSDPDGTIISFKIIEVGNNLSASLNGTVLILKPQKDFYGVSNVTIGAQDSNHTWRNETIIVKVNPVDDPPLLNMPLNWNITITPGERYILDLTDMISDVDTTLKNITVDVNCPYAEVNGSKVTFLFPENSTISMVILNVTLSDGNLSTNWPLQIDMKPNQESVNITFAEIKVDSEGAWHIRVSAVPESSIYIVINNVGSFKLNETLPGNYTLYLPKDIFRASERYSYHFSDQIGGEDVAPSFSGIIKEPRGKVKEPSAFSYLIIVAVAITALLFLIFLFTRGGEVEEE